MSAASSQLLWVQVVQQYSPPGSETAARVLSHLGGEWFYLLVIPLLLWRAPWPLAVRAAQAMIVADLVGEGIKWSLLWPRPPQEMALTLETSPGFVSTHASVSLAVAMTLWAHHRGRLFALGLALWVLGVAWSRLRLGVHFPLDIVGGWAVALLVAGVVHRWGGPQRRGHVLALGVALLSLFLWPDTGTESLWRDLGMLAGLQLGVQGSQPPEEAFRPPLAWPEVAFRLVGLALFYFGLKAFEAPRFLRYLVLGLWASLRWKKTFSPERELSDP